ncbi:MAG: DUF3362 domain-containing protein, partial [Gammaproteobacteria bacterium]
PYFIAAHPGTTDNDMVELALWLKKNGFRADQVQSFYPSPMATATAMYHSGKNPLHRLRREGGDVDIVRKGKQRKLHKALLRYHDPNNWPVIRRALKQLGRADLIGYARRCLVPPRQPATDQGRTVAGHSSFLTRHTGIPKAATTTRKKTRVTRSKRHSSGRTRQR